MVTVLSIVAVRPRSVVFVSAAIISSTAPTVAVALRRWQGVRGGDGLRESKSTGEGHEGAEHGEERCGFHDEREVLMRLGLLCVCRCSCGT